MATNSNISMTSKGGLWNTQAVSYSKETQNLLKEMMQESKLTMFQQKHINQTLRNGRTLPVNVPPTHSYHEKIIKPPAPSSKVIKVRDYTGGIRTKDDIERTGVYERPDYKPRPQRCRTEKHKETLRNIMAYGTDLPPPDMKKAIERVLPRDDTIVDRFDELEKEVAERREFLNDMTAIGKGDEYRKLIDTEISQKVREMEIIDRKRNEELQERIQQLENKRQHCGDES